MNSNFMNGFADEFFKVGAANPDGEQGTNYVRGTMFNPRAAQTTDNKRLMTTASRNRGRKYKGSVVPESSITGKSKPKTTKTRFASMSPEAIANDAVKHKRKTRNFDKNPTPWQTELRKNKAGSQGRKDMLAKGKKSHMASLKPGGAAPAAAPKPAPAPAAVAAAPKPAKNWQGQPSKADVGKPKGMRAHPGTDAGRNQAKVMRQARKKSTRTNLQAGRAYTAVGPGGAAPSQPRTTPQPKRSAAVASFDTPKKPKTPGSNLVAGVTRAAKAMNPFG